MGVPLQGCIKSECRSTCVRMQWVHWNNCALYPLLAVSCGDTGLGLFTLTVSSPRMGCTILRDITSPKIIHHNQPLWAFPFHQISIKFIHLQSEFEGSLESRSGPQRLSILAQLLYVIKRGKRLTALNMAAYYHSKSQMSCTGVQT
jgi:hypothetical protein